MLWLAFIFTKLKKAVKNVLVALMVALAIQRVKKKALVEVVAQVAHLHSAIQTINKPITNSFHITKATGIILVAFVFLFSGN